MGGEDLPEDQRRLCGDGWQVSDAEDREEAIEGRKESAKKKDNKERKEEAASVAKDDVPTEDYSDPDHRIKAASDSGHPFLSTPNLSVTVSVEEGRHGPGSICSGFLDEEVLDYLQNCPSWAEFRDECLANNFEASRCISEDESRRRMKREFVGYVSAENQPPKCKSLNSDANLQPIRAVRAAFFARALRKRTRGWLHQLQERMRSEIRRVGLPVDVLPNASPFVDEELSDNAFAYASVQVCKVGEREDGWHTDGGASLLHAGLTISGAARCT